MHAKEQELQSPSMTPKEQFDALMKLAEFRVDRLKMRRELEWRISASLWVFLATSIYYFKHRPCEELLLTMLGSIVLVHCVAWVWHLWRANRRDGEAAFIFFNQAHSILNGGEPMHSLSRYRQDWLSPIQAVVTLVLAVIAYLLIGKHYFDL